MAETHGLLTLGQARSWLVRVKEARRGGVASLDVLLRELRDHLKPVAAPAPAAGELSATVEHDLEEYCSLVLAPNRQRSIEWVRYLFRRFIGLLGPDTLMMTVDKTSIRKVIEILILQGHRALAGAILDNVRPFFAWAADTGRIIKDPTASLTRKTFRLPRSRRRRSLKPVELPVFWNALRAAAVGRRRRTCLALQVILLTGVRVGQLCRALWADIDFADATWTIPYALRKRTHPHGEDAEDFVIPLAPQAMDLFRELKRLAGDSPFVLPGKPGTHIGTGTPLEMLHRLFGSRAHAALRALEGGPFTVHDLRRTMRTQLGRLHVPYDIAERCLDHSISDMDETYDQGDHIDERRAAANLLARYLEEFETIPLEVSETPVAQSQ